MNGSSRQIIEEREKNLSLTGFEPESLLHMSRTLTNYATKASANQKTVHFLTKTI